MIVTSNAATPDAEVLASGAGEQPPARITGQPVTAEEGAVGPPDEDAGSIPP